MKFNEYLSVLVYKLVLVINLINGKMLNERDKNAQIVDVIAVEGKSALLQCPISSPLSDVSMVFFFKSAHGGIPLYSVDMRDKTSQHQPKHWSAPEVFGSRANFSIDNKPESLVIKDIKRHDQGVYRCRIDFLKSQTQSYTYNLSVIILPESPVVLDRWGRQLNSTKIGPMQEAEDIILSCRVVGGRPQPTVRWLINGLPVDDQYEHNSGDVIENRLLWPQIQRSDLNSIFTCQASNTKLVEPKETSFVLDMHLKPLTVEIRKPPTRMVADRRYEIICESSGSRPNAIITWYKGKRQLRRTKDEILNNTTKSELSFSPTVEDDGKFIVCRAENPVVSGLFLEATHKLSVVYPPLVTLQLGSTLSNDDIKEGDDVYFECHVEANPKFTKLSWLHNGIHLTHNASARIIRSNQSLVLQKITRNSSGNYACSALNSEGETVSNQLPLRVKYAPVCATEKVVLIGAAKDENVEIICDIYADPPARKFRWKFNNSGEILFLDSERYSKNGTRSILHYTPVTEQDFGTLSCWAINEIGEQSVSCLFQVVLAVTPSPVINCSVSNYTREVAEILCTSGYDGGLPQRFLLEMISRRNKAIKYNFTNADEPFFVLDMLELINAKLIEENDSVLIVVYAVNQKGRSSPVIIRDLELGAVVKLDRDNLIVVSSQESTPYFIGIIATILIVFIFIAFKIMSVCWTQDSSKRSATATTTPTTTTFSHNDHNGTTKLTNHSNNLLIISSYNGSIGKKNGLSNGQAITTFTSPTNSLKSNKPTLDDDRDPDLIPTYHQYGSSISTAEEPYSYKSFQQQDGFHLISTSALSRQAAKSINDEIKERLMSSKVPESCV
ncbi:synaptogenesis protein syg-1-like isoform X1 [Chironomus tepperi]|uniref:synaptogenesis protein syg-1-like isoform X1 n=2 Tax=Chironomus tepperi TaxID=113505 RepID=UPI00391F2942